MHWTILTLALIIYYSFHSVLAATLVKQWVMLHLIPQKYYRLLYNVIAIGLLWPLYWVYQHTEQHQIMSKWSPIGMLLLGLGIVLVVLSLRQYNLLRFAGLDNMVGKASSDSSHLVTTGLHAWVRHPLYLGIWQLVWGAFFCSPTLALLLVAIITSIYIFIGAQLEERKLVKEFGEEYRDYQERVPILFPGGWK